MGGRNQVQLSLQTVLDQAHRQSPGSRNLSKPVVADRSRLHMARACRVRTPSETADTHEDWPGDTARVNQAAVQREASHRKPVLVAYRLIDLETVVEMAEVAGGEMVANFAPFRDDSGWARWNVDVTALPVVYAPAPAHTQTVPCSRHGVGCGDLTASGWL